VTRFRHGHPADAVCQEAARAPHRLVPLLVVREADILMPHHERFAVAEPIHGAAQVLADGVPSSGWCWGRASKTPGLSWLGKLDAVRAGGPHAAPTPGHDTMAVSRNVGIFEGDNRYWAGVKPRRTHVVCSSPVREEFRRLRQQ